MLIVRLSLDVYRDDTYHRRRRRDRCNAVVAVVVSTTETRKTGARRGEHLYIFRDLLPDDLADGSRHHGFSSLPGESPEEKQTEHTEQDVWKPDQQLRVQPW